MRINKIKKYWEKKIFRKWGWKGSVYECRKIHAERRGRDEQGRFVGKGIKGRVGMRRVTKEISKIKRHRINKCKGVFKVIRKKK